MMDRLGIAWHLAILAREAAWVFDFSSWELKAFICSLLPYAIYPTNRNIRVLQ